MRFARDQKVSQQGIEAHLRSKASCGFKRKWENFCVLFLNFFFMQYCQYPLVVIRSSLTDKWANPTLPKTFLKLHCRLLLLLFAHCFYKQNNIWLSHKDNHLFGKIEEKSGIKCKSILVIKKKKIHFSLLTLKVPF